MSSLYEIEEQFRQLEQDLLEAEGELTDELEERLEINRDEFEQKMTAYAKLIAGRKAENESITAEINRLNKRAFINETLIKRLKEHMLHALLIMGEEDKSGVRRLRTTLFNIFTRRSTACEILVEDAVPKKFKHVSVEVKIDKAGILEALRAGNKVKGCALKENYSVQIK